VIADDEPKHAGSAPGWRHRLHSLIRDLHTGFGLDTFWVYGIEAIFTLWAMFVLYFDLGWSLWAAATLPCLVLLAWLAWVFRGPRGP
jgi:hypothetical protein